MTFEEQFQAAKEKIRIPELWTILGYHGTPTKSCKSPWREEKSASWSLVHDGRGFVDYGGGGKKGDQVTFLEISCGLSRGAAMKRLVEIAFGGRTDMKSVEVLQKIEKELPLGNHRKKPVFPVFTPPQSWHYKDLSKLRSIPVEALELAVQRELLAFGYYKGRSSWFVLDKEKVNGQARRMDGEIWKFDRDGEVVQMKAHTLPFSWPQWPLGIGNAKRGSRIFLTEGGPDMLASCFLMLQDEQAVPAGMLGASNPIHVGALPFFHNTEVTIFMHNEAPKPVKLGGKLVMPEFSAGETAARNWRKQLEPFTKKVTLYKFPNGIKDLNDYIKEYDGI